MNRVTIIILGVFMALFSSCQFSENIYINEDGSGNMIFSMDASELMEMAASMGDGQPQQGMDKAVDSTIVFKDFLIENRDSIAKLPEEDQKKLKALEDFEMHMVTNPESKKMIFDLSSKFKSANELQDTFEAMNSIGNLQGQGGVNAGDATNPFASMSAGGNTVVQYSFKNNVFKRSAKVRDTVVQQQALDSLGEMSMMFEASKYTLNYHFKTPVKSVSNANATISDDRKIVSLEVGFMESIQRPEILDLEVTLED